MKLTMTSKPKQYIKKRSVPFVLILLLFCTSCSARQTEQSEENSLSSTISASVSAKTDDLAKAKGSDNNLLSVKEKLLRSALYLTCDSNGTTANGVIAVITDDEIIIVTNAHVAALIQDSEGHAYAQATDGFPAFSVKVLLSDENSDLAFLTANTKDLDPELLDYLSAVTCDSSAYDALQKGDILTCMYLDRIDPTGFFYPEPCLGEAILLDKNVPVEGFESNMMYLDYASVKGMSGSGIFDLSGNLVGLLSAGDEKQGTTLAVPLPDFISAFESAMHFLE